MTVQRRPVIGRLAVTVAAGLLVTSAAVAGFKTKAVQIQLPDDAKVDTTGLRRVLVGGFLVNDFGDFDMHREMVRLLRRGLIKNTDLLILEDPPTSLPEQTLEDLKINAPFYQTIAEDYAADLIVSGRLYFDAADRSGFVQEEILDPMSGRRSLRSRFMERTGFSLRLDLILVRGSDGELIYDVSFFEDDIYSAEQADSLQAFFDLAERFRDKFLALFTTQQRLETRYLFTE